MSSQALDRNSLGILYRKYSDAKRIGWTVKGSRTKNNQTIEINRSEILHVLDKAYYAEYLFQECYYLEQLLGAIVANAPPASLPMSLEDYRKTWTGEQYVSSCDTKLSETTIAEARKAFPNPEALGYVEQAILYILCLQMEKEHKDTALQALFMLLPNSVPAPRGKLRCGRCDWESDILDSIEQCRNVAYCRLCGQRIC